MEPWLRRRVEELLDVRLKPEACRMGVRFLLSIVFSVFCFLAGCRVAGPVEVSPDYVSLSPLLPVFAGKGFHWSPPSLITLGMNTTPLSALISIVNENVSTSWSVKSMKSHTASCIRSSSPF